MKQIPVINKAAVKNYLKQLQEVNDEMGIVSDRDKSATDSDAIPRYREVGKTRAVGG
jgi:hypothetical protein